MRRWLIAAALLVGCGGSDPRDELAGTDWALTSGSCADVVSFDESGGYTLGTGCPDGAAIDMYVEGGEYQVSGSTLVFTAHTASCAVTTNVSTYRFNRVGSTLSVTDGTTALVFQRQTPGPGSGAAIVYGCFDATGAFTPMAVHSVP